MIPSPDVSVWASFKGTEMTKKKEQPFILYTIACFTVPEQLYLTFILTLLAFCHPILFLFFYSYSFNIFCNVVEASLLTRLVTVPIGVNNLNFKLAYQYVFEVWDENQITRRKPTQALGEHTNSMQVLSLVEFGPTIPVLQD